MTTIISVNNLSVHAPSEEYSQHIETNYIVPGKLVIEQSVDTVTGLTTFKMQFASPQDFNQFKVDPVVVAERNLASASIVNRSVYQQYQQPV
jgi:hypothetical protein